ncbi:MAG TPA: hypothetical protein VGE35_03865 [Candidatus Paceibacterota bacterium]
MKLREQNYEGNALKIKGAAITYIGTKNLEEEAIAALERFVNGDWGTTATAAANDGYIAKQQDGRVLMGQYPTTENGMSIVINAVTLKPGNGGKMEVSQAIVGQSSQIAKAELNLATGMTAAAASSTAGSTAA